MHNLNIRRPFPLWKARGKDEAWRLDKHGAPRVCPGLKAEDTTESVTTGALHYVYNSLVDFIKRNATLGSIILNAKSEKEVGAKYAQHCKEAALLNSFLSSNNGN